jgi:AraC family transcriptional regulator
VPVDSGDKHNAVRRMQEYIEEHLAEPITLRMLADAAGYSPWHAERIFKEVTGQTPFEYLRAARLSQAAAQLRDSDARIVDVAFDFVFGSHEGFTRAFSRHFGMTPQEYRKIAPLSKFFVPNPTRGYHLTSAKGAKGMSENLGRLYVQVEHRPVFVQVVDRPARKLILKWAAKATHYGEYYDEVIRDIEEEHRWNALFANIKEALSGIIGLWLPENLRKPGASIFSLGVEVPTDYAGEVPAGFDLIDLPPCKMMFFQGPPYEEGESQMGQAMQLIHHAIDTYDPKIYGFEWADEDGPRFQLAPMGYRGYIEARPVRELNAKSAKERPGKAVSDRIEAQTRAARSPLAPA